MSSLKASYTVEVTISMISVDPASLDIRKDVEHIRFSGNLPLFH